MGACRAKMAVINLSGETIENVRFWHRYDDKAHDLGQYVGLPNGANGHHGTHEADNFGARFWTWHWGSDYWKVEFEVGDFRYFTDDDIKYDLSGKSDKNYVSIVITKKDGQFAAFVMPNDSGTSFTGEKSPTRILTSDISPRLRKQKESEGYAAFARKRPFYVIAHECNTPERCRAAIEQGANAIELDVTYNDTLEKWFVRHWGLADATPWPELLSGSTIDQVFPYLNQSSKQHNSISIVILDIKSRIKTREIFDGLYDNVRAMMPDLGVILSVSKIDEARSLLAACHDIRDIDGFAVDRDSDPEAVYKLFEENRRNRLWLGYGITSLLNAPSDYRKVLDRCGSLREQRGIVTKTYYWTLLNEKSIIDAVFTKGQDRWREIDGIIVELEKVSFTVKQVVQSIYLRMAEKRDNFDVWPPH